ncbi:hypothetical protein IJ732_06505 [bacterium]|nr:hypothetical protein [bacterium]
MNKLIKKTIFTAFVIFSVALNCFASNADDAKKFFNRYVSAANSYSDSVPDFYSSNAKIIRQVVKPNGQTVDVPFTMAQYKNQMKISAKIAKMKNYKNAYSGITVKKINANTYQIDAYRQPSLGGDKLKTSTTVQKQPNGSWLIIKEMMQTKEQIFLKYAK